MTGIPYSVDGCVVVRVAVQRRPAKKKKSGDEKSKIFSLFAPNLESFGSTIDCAACRNNVDPEHCVAVYCVATWLPAVMADEFQLQVNFQLKLYVVPEMIQIRLDVFPKNRRYS